MTFLRPGMLWLLPLAAIPVLIHLLNRMKYHRLGWAAMAFLRATEQRAVRRARLRQVLLLVVRTLLLAAALLALARPSIRGGLARYLGQRPVVAVVLDASASMGRGRADGSPFDRAKRFAAEALAGLPRRARAIAGTAGGTWQSPFEAPVTNLDAVSRAILESRPTEAAGNVPLALSRAAESVSPDAGTIIFLTDCQATDWRAEDAGAWAGARSALGRVRRPVVIVVRAASLPDRNLAVISVRTEPGIVLAGRASRLVATVAAEGEDRDEGGARVRLYLDDALVGSTRVAVAPGRPGEAAFEMPPLPPGPHAVRVELDGDDMPADDSRFALLDVLDELPVLVVCPESRTADYVVKALRPPSGTSPFAPRQVRPEDLAREDLGDVAAVFLLGTPPTDPTAAGALQEYVRAGGLLMVFPDTRSAAAAWGILETAGVRVIGRRSAQSEEPIRVVWTSPLHPVTATLADEGAGRVEIEALLQFEVAAPAEVLARTSTGDPFLVRATVGQGLMYLFAVSADTEASNLPLTPIFPLSVYRAIEEHLPDLRGTAGHEVGSPIRVPARGSWVHLPDGRLLPVPDSGELTDTPVAGIYRLRRRSRAYDGGSRPTPPAENGLPVAAVNVPVSESSISEIRPETIRTLLANAEVRFASLSEGVGTALGGEAPADYVFLVAAAVLMVGQAALGALGRDGRRAHGVAAPLPGVKTVG